MSTRPAAGGYSGAVTQGDKKAWVEGLNTFGGETPGWQDEEALTIAAGAITPTRALASVDTEAAAATDDLDHAAITNHGRGKILILRAVNAGHVVTVKHGGGGNGEFLMADARDFILDTTTDRIAFVQRLDKWEEIFRTRTNRLNRVVDKTGAYTIVVSDHDVTFTNRGAGALVPLTLLGVPGLTVRGWVQNVNGLRFQLPGGATLREGGSVTSAGGTMTSTAIGDYTTVECLTATEFVVRARGGAAWTFA